MAVSMSRAPAAPAGGWPERTTITKSFPAGSALRTWRKASRSRRFQRFRTTAEPIRRETDRPTRTSSGFAPRAAP